MSDLPGPLHPWITDESAKVVLGVWMRDLLGVSDDLEGLRQSVWIGWLEALVGEFGLGRQAPLHDLLG